MGAGRGATPPAAALRSSPGGHYGEVLYRLPAGQLPGGGPAFNLVIYQDTHDPGRCLVEVQVQPEGWNWPDLEGYTVILHAGGEARIMQTDAWGLASFEGVALDQLGEAGLTIQM